MLTAQSWPNWNWSALNMSEDFYVVRGFEAGTRYQLLQRGKRTPTNSMDRWSMMAASWALMRLSMRVSDPFNCDSCFLSWREPAKRLSIMLVLDRQFSLEARLKQTCQILSFKLSLEKLVVSTPSGCNFPSTGASDRKPFWHIFPFSSDPTYLTALLQLPHFQ